MMRLTYLLIFFRLLRVVKASSEPRELIIICLLPCRCQLIELSFALNADIFYKPLLFKLRKQRVQCSRPELDALFAAVSDVVADVDASFFAAAQRHEQVRHRLCQC